MVESYALFLAALLLVGGVLGDLYGRRRVFAVGVALWLGLNRTKFGMMIRAGVDDRVMLSASAVNVGQLFVGVFAIGGGLAGLSGVIGGSALSVAPGEDVRYLLASLVVVILGGMGSIAGAAMGALLIGLAEQVGLVYFPTYGVVLTFAIMVITLAQGLALERNLFLKLCVSDADARTNALVRREEGPRTAAVRSSTLFLWQAG